MPNLVSHVWKPSHSRAIKLDGFVPVPRGTSVTAPSFLNWPSKDPGDVLDYILDIEPAILGNEGDCIITTDVSVSPSAPGDLLIDNVAVDGYVLVIWVSAGQPATIYNVTIVIGLASGRILQRTVLLPVVALSSISAPFNTLQTSVGDPLTDQDGNPIVS